DYRPLIVLPIELPPVAAERSSEPAVLLERLERAEELGAVVVVEPRVAADALPFQHVALAVGEHRPPERPRLERHHREALVVGRHDQQLRTRDRVELVGVVEEAEMANARVDRKSTRLNSSHRTISYA